MQDSQITTASCFELCKSIFCLDAAPADLKEAALRALGSVMMACPETLKYRSCQPLLSAALKPKASHPLKRAALNIILELLNADEEKLGVEQKKKTDPQRNGKKKGKAQKNSESVATENGEMDSISTTSSIVQVAIAFGIWN